MKDFAKDCVGILFVIILSIIGGLAINTTRSTPVPLIYATPQSRLDEVVKQMGAMNSFTTSGTDINLEQMENINSQHTALVLDARPAIFYRLGHIPSAVSLSRDDFKSRYQTLQKILNVYHDKPLVVYCASSDCNDSQMVAEALRKLDYHQVRVFRGGWSDWQEANLPEEK